ncbi:hypothetical protein NDU88_007621 [Pleurodeles waltl]|uniref:Uncharacterized protein n=1 Tax=Pleurodeles waltl TaxID=8319 RepID=A0AAV7N2M0_PLEWA|nr:hypothetical protein NDU88_007621 [Pleurodeles waltl]
MTRSACLALHRQSRAFFLNVRLSRRSLLRSASRFNAFPQKSSASTDASLRCPSLWSSFLLVVSGSALSTGCIKQLISIGMSNCCAAADTVRAERSARGAAVVPGGRGCRAPSVLYFLARGPKVGMGLRRVLGAARPQY